jgi:hypothetical protein
MSRILSRERCPECAKVGRDRSEDNLVVYDTGSMHCFSCGYHIGGGIKGHRMAVNEPIDEFVSIVCVPGDSDTTIPAKALEWLKQYGITFTDVVANSLLWSESGQLLVFPFDGAWQGRYFGEDEKKPKWFTKGNIDEIIHGFNLQSVESGVILVEDIVSAIRVGHSGYPCICLFGSHVSPRKTSQLLHLTNRVIFWLDYDKRESATAQARKLLDYGIESDLIITRADPKCFSDEVIKAQIALIK